MGHVTSVELDPMYNEVSSLSFVLPATVDGVTVPYYDQVVGMNIIDLREVGQFVLTNPVEHDDGIQRYKECKAYSLEYEFTYKKFFLAKGTYNFWNPVAPHNTILGMILDIMPSWGPGNIDATLVGVYRTFELNGSENVFNVIKSKLQKTYNCIFTFDTYNRTISVKDVSAHVKLDEVYLSLDNLVKNIEIEEDTESIVTCLDVNGADGVDIRAVNPMGTNKIYNLDYWMNNGAFSYGMKTKYEEWKTAFQAAQMPYYNLTIHKMLQTTKLLAERSDLVQLQDDLKSQENLQAVYIEALSEKLEPVSDFEQKLLTARNEIARLQASITIQNNLIAETQSEIDALTAQQKETNTATSFDKFFDEAELQLLDRYIKEDSISESSFVMPSSKNYNVDDQHWLVNGESVSLVSNLEQLQTDDGVLFTARGGTITFGAFTGELVSATFERKASDQTFLFTAYLASSEVQDQTTGETTAYKNACLSIAGTAGVVAPVVAPDHSLYSHSVDFAITEATAYFTVNLTEYDRFAVSWDLFNYGMECLEKFAYPTYQFKIEVANFLSLEDYIHFQKQLTLGDRVYLQTGDHVITPILIGAHIEYEHLDTLAMTFNDTFSANDPAFGLAALLEQSVSMGHTLDTDRYSYAEFIASGADTSVKEYMDNALDVARQEILSSAGQQITWGSEGLRLRQKLEDGTYHDEQTWMVNNKILFTDDGWQTVKGLVGKFNDPNLGDMYGLMMPYLSGTIMASNNLIVESAKQDGGKSVFRVDGDGAALHNATFDLYNESANLQITLNPDLGIAIGTSSLYSIDETTTQKTLNEDNARFWADTDGNLHLKGIIEAEGGTFSGELKAATGTFSGELSAATGSFSGKLEAATGSFAGDISAATGTFRGEIAITSADGSKFFMVDSLGNLYANSATISGTITASDIDVNPTTATRLNDLLKSGYSYFDGSYITNLNAGHITAGSISTDLLSAGSIDADKICIRNNSGGLMQGTGGYTDLNGLYHTTSGIMLYGGNILPAWLGGTGQPSYYVIATDSGVRMQAVNHWISVWNGGAGTNATTFSTSDRRAKHNIVCLKDSENIDVFYRQLTPVSFIRNDDPTEKIQYGFIAQEVESALNAAGLDSSIHAMVLRHEVDGYEDEYMLSYNDFISLNTYMIQKLYARVEELETQISLLKENTNDN